MHRVNQAKCENWYKCRAAGRGGRRPRQPSLQLCGPGVATPKTGDHVQMTATVRDSVGGRVSQHRKEKQSSARPDQGDPDGEASLGRSRPCPLLQLLMRPRDRAWPPFTAFCPHLCPEAPACPLTPSRPGRLFATSLQALQLPECSRDTPVCSLFPGGIHLGHARVSVYGLRCLRLPLGSGLLLVLLAACAPAKELHRPSRPRLLRRL